MSSKHGVVAVTLNWKDVDTTIECVSSLLSEQPIEQVIVVDNESDGCLARKLPPDARIQVIELPENRGFSAGTNAGISAALLTGSEYILVINNDAAVMPSAVAVMRSMLEEDARLGMVAPLLLDPSGNVQSYGGILSRTCRASEATAPLHREPDFLTWACVMLRRAMVQDIGQLDEGYFMYWEDVDFGFRARDAGWKLGIAHDSQVVHKVAASHTRAGTKIMLYSALGLAVLARRRGGLLLIGALIRLLGRLLRASLNGNPAESRAIFMGIKLGLHGHEVIYPFVSEFLTKTQNEAAGHRAR